MSPPKAATETAADLKLKILDLLDENRVMSVATVRPDGWPQATIVGYVHDDLTLYFAVARNSQKYANITSEPRISLALGHHTSNRLRGLSMAAHAAEVTEAAEIANLNTLMLQRYPGQVMFSPREASSAIMRALPTVVSIIDLAKGPGEPELVEVGHETVVSRIRNAARDHAGQTIDVHYVRSGEGGFRPDAPF